MSDIFFELQERLTPALRAGDLASCERVVSKQLAALPHSPFHVALDLSITNSPADVAAHFDGFFRREAARFAIKATYAEMNGFDINPDCWYFDVFAFSDYGGHDDYDWLSDWQSSEYDTMAICGLERLQEVYASDAFQDEQYRDAIRVSGLLVVIKFQDLIQKAAPQIHGLQFPLLATAHDYDFIYEVQRSA